jgi:hypothetical protein
MSYTSGSVNIITTRIRICREQIIYCIVLHFKETINEKQCQNSAASRTPTSGDEKPKISTYF